MEITFEFFLKKVDNTFSSTPELRRGQTIMNILWEVWPDKHKEIIGSDFDCFYCDDRVNSTLDKLKKDWLKK